MGVTADESLQIGAAAGETSDAVGAGDSMVGAMCLKLAAGAGLGEMVRFGVAAGTAATLRPGTQLCDPQATNRLYRQIGLGR